MPAVKRFFDTNIFVYAADRADPRKQVIARDLIHEGLDRGDVVISTQVVKEFCNTLYRIGDPAAAGGDAKRWIDTVFQSMTTIDDSVAQVRRAIDLKARWGFSFYDAMIVAAALQGACTTLISEDFQHGQSISGLSICNPFVG